VSQASSLDTPIDLQTAIRCPRERLAAWAPQTVVWAPGGTRRHAIAAGVPIDDSYIDWAWEQHMRCIELFFALGVQTLFVPVLGPPQVREVGSYRERLFASLRRIADPPSMEIYRRHGIRVRAYGHQRIPGMSNLVAQLESETAALGPCTLWHTMVVEGEDEPFSDAFQAARQAGAMTLDESVRAFYGERISPVDVFISFGKLQTGYLMPPLLDHRASLYWTIFPSYMMTETHLRTIFWDYRFARATWVADKSRRYESIDPHMFDQAAERPGGIIGVGRRAGAFWTPDHSPSS
jgi:tuberculosinol/isotuberculosinol synthase